MINNIGKYFIKTSVSLVEYMLGAWEIQYSKFKYLLVVYKRAFITLWSFKSDLIETIWIGDADLPKRLNLACVNTHAYIRVPELMRLDMCTGAPVLIVFVLARCDERILVIVLSAATTID